MTQLPARFDHVGSFLRPAALLDARERNRNGASDRAHTRGVEDAANRHLVPPQADPGHQALTDREVRPPTRPRHPPCAVSGQRARHPGAATPERADAGDNLDVGELRQRVRRAR